MSFPAVAVGAGTARESREEKGENRNSPYPLWEGRSFTHLLPPVGSADSHWLPPILSRFCYYKE